MRSWGHSDFFSLSSSRTGCQSRNISFLLFPGNLPFPSPLRSIIQIQAVCHHTGKTFSCIPSLSFSIFKYSFSVAWSSSSSFLSPPPPLSSSQPISLMLPHPDVLLLPLIRAPLQELLWLPWDPVYRLTGLDPPSELTLWVILLLDRKRDAATYFIHTSSAK